MRFPLRIWLGIAAPMLVAFGVFVVLFEPSGLRAALTGSFWAGTGTSLWIALRWRRIWIRQLLHLEGITRALLRGERTDRSGLAGREDVGPLAQAIDELSVKSVRQVSDVRAERDRLRAILARVPDGILVTDAQGRAELANQSFQTWFGLAEPIAGRSHVELSRNPALHALVEDTLADGATRHGELELAAPERRELELSALALPDRGGMVLVVRDATAERRLAEMRRDFVANVSHELKTPLAAIRGFAETLRDGALDEPPTAHRFVDRILAQARRLQALLEDLLTLSRLESLGRSPERQRVDLPSLARRVAESTAPLAQEKNVRVELVPGEPARYSGDAESLERMVSNLVENAVKYNRPGGSVRVEITHPASGPVFTVRDDGIGIPHEVLPRVFERFYRVDKARSREEGGTGLGLAIVKHVAQSHGGRVEVESELGKGTTFRVFLPPSPED
jgi:two-component system phosphate regulon sensor histidine kinase PhoR